MTASNMQLTLEVYHARFLSVQRRAVLFQLSTRCNTQGSEGYAESYCKRREMCASQKPNTQIKVQKSSLDTNCSEL